MTYTRRLGAGVCCYGVSQIGLWAQDDIAVAKTVAISLGLRQEAESRMSRALNLAPRGQLDWSPVRVPHTTFHLGGGVFHAWLTPRIGRSAADGQFEILLEARQPIAPDPYLVQSSPRFASAMRSPLLRVV